MIRTRIAPSPTGYLHLGTARTALFNYLFAKKQGGSFVLRVEDTDRERSDKKFEEEIFESLEWLGMSADESPRIGGPFGPYRQSERAPSYRRALEKLVAAGWAFGCPHSPKALEEERTALMAEGKTPLHLCSEREKYGGGEGLIRFKAPHGRELIFTDRIRGEIRFASDLIGDFALAKNLDTPLYNFAVVIDDAEMNISHVIRGEEHIANTPKQILIQEALELSTPEYAHLPLILGPDRSKLSKRHGATALYEFRAAGYLPEAMVNFLALLGWNPGGDREIFSLTELVALFDLAKVQKSGAVCNGEKLDWMNSEYLRHKPLTDFVELARPYMLRQIPHLDTFDAAYIRAVVGLEQSRLKKLSDIGERVDYFFHPPEYEAALLPWKNMSHAEIQRALEEAKDIIAAIPLPLSQEKTEQKFLQNIGEHDKGTILWPLRVALTGKKASPGPFEILEILGKDEGLRRIDTALKKIF